MSIPAIVAIIVGILITLAFVNLLVNGRSHQRRLGPVNPALAPGNPTPQDQNVVIQTTERRFVYKPWMGIASVAVVAAIAIVTLAILFWASIAAAVGAPRWEYVVLLAALAILVLAAAFPAARNAIAALPRPVVIIVLVLLLVVFWNTLLALLPLETQVNVLVAQKRITDNLFLVLVVLAVALLFISKRAAIVAGTLAALVFFLSTDSLGLTRAEKVHAWWNTPSAPRQYAEPRKEWGLAVAPTSPCNSREVPYLYEARKPARPFNKAGQCGPVLWYKGYCVWALGYKSSTPVKLCDKPGMPRGEVPLSLEYVWSAEGYSFQDKYRLDPPRYTTLLNIAQ